eukprot:CAMPEP_0203735452 /NCGR_PEP_ID=MMETSP0092-20131115/32288_1 /ASSEMBLY_ACC=CAM_ASM_001090 /TAXON_ID=426623 /ORGANISM="Chaetoceros affinis, Strain CCMP159" /LENGTH=217 /DNA_ID=CAMNT_0050620001 /DNA_START=56 /DNA_END=709 /DNA_ORIENTATION=-
MPQYNTRHASPLRSLENSVKSDNAKIREKLANRRSILNQSDGRIRTPSRPREDFPNIPRARSFDASHLKVEGADLPPHLMNHLQGLKEGSFRSISQKRERKEAAEMRLKGLFSKSLTMNKSEDSMAIAPRNISFSDQSYHSPSDNKSSKSTDSPASTESADIDEESSFNPSSFEDDNEEEEEEKVEEELPEITPQIKQHFSKQEHIQVYDSFIVIKV